MNSTGIAGSFSRMARTKAGPSTPGMTTPGTNRPNPPPAVFEGKRLVVVDDSIVRGNTQRAIVRMLREAGAAEVHVRISSPPVLWPCFYGIDFATRAELIANGLAVDEIRQSVGADSLTYISLEELVEATTISAEKLCTACFTGEYPIALPDPEALGKHLLEGYERESTTTSSVLSGDADGLASLTAATGASDALGRP